MEESARIVEESVRIVNEGDEELNLPYDGRLYTLAPGESRFFPIDVMYAWMGNPAVRNVENNEWRTEAYENLVTFYGGAGRHITGAEADEFLPALAAYNSRDEQIMTIIDDPKGEHLVADSPVGSNEAILNDRIARLEAQLAAQSSKPSRSRRSTKGANQTERAPEPVAAMPPSDEPNIIKVD